jgi:hypothetical protein
MATGKCIESRFILKCCAALRQSLAISSTIWCANLDGCMTSWCDGSDLWNAASGRHGRRISLGDRHSEGMSEPRARRVPKRPSMPFYCRTPFWRERPCGPVLASLVASVSTSMIWVARQKKARKIFERGAIASRTGPPRTDWRASVSLRRVSSRRKLRHPQPPGRAD